MSMKVLIAWPPETSTIPFSSLQAYHFAHFGEAASYVKRFFETTVMDGGAFTFGFSDFAKEFCKDYDVLVVMNQVHNVPYVIRLSKLYKEINPKGKVITFGIASNYIPDFFEKYLFDAIVDSGDWECGLRDYLEFLSSDSVNLNDISGLRIFQNGRFYRTGQGNRLDPVKWSYPSLIDLPYKDFTRLSQRNEYTVTASKGCPYPCPYCNIPLIFGRKDRRRPVQPLVEHLRNITQTYDFDTIRFFTPTFTLKSRWNWIKEFCKEIVSQNVNIRYRFVTRIDCLDEEIISILRESGCFSMGLGIETIGKASSNINKSVELSVMKTNIKLLMKHDIKPKALLMLGVPGQTFNEVVETIRLLISWGVGIEDIRPTAYSPYQNLKSNMSPSEIASFDRRTYYPMTGINDMDNSKFLRFIYNTQDMIKEVI